MAFQPGLMNRALSNREMFRQVQTMPVTAYDPRPRKAQELMDYVSEGTEGQFDRPIIKMKQSGSRRRGGGSREEGAGTETGQNLANLMGSIVKESTTGKRYTGNVSQRAWDDHGKARAAYTRKTGDIPSDKQVPPPKGEFKYVEEGTEGQPGLTDVVGATGHEYSQSLQAVRHASPRGFIEGIAKLPDAPSMRAKGSRGHFDSGHA